MTLLQATDGIEYNALIEEVITLLKNDIDDDLLACLQESKREIFCHLLLLLNQVNFSIRKNVSAKTIIHIDDDDTVSVYGLYPFTNKDGYKAQVINPVFSSRYLKSDIFDGELTRKEVESQNLVFSDELKKIIKTSISEAQ